MFSHRSDENAPPQRLNWTGLSATTAINKHQTTSREGNKTKARPVGRPPSCFLRPRGGAIGHDVTGG